LPRGKGTPRSSKCSGDEIRRRSPPCMSSRERPERRVGTQQEPDQPTVLGRALRSEREPGRNSRGKLAEKRRKKNPGTTYEKGDKPRDRNAEGTSVWGAEIASWCNSHRACHEKLRNGEPKNIVGAEKPLPVFFCGIKGTLTPLTRWSTSLSQSAGASKEGRKI